MRSSAPVVVSCGQSPSLGLPRPHPLRPFTSSFFTHHFSQLHSLASHSSTPSHLIPHNTIPPPLTVPSPHPSLLHPFTFSSFDLCTIQTIHFTLNPLPPYSFIPSPATPHSSTIIPLPPTFIPSTHSPLHSITPHTLSNLRWKSVCQRCAVLAIQA